MMRTHTVTLTSLVCLLAAGCGSSTSSTPPSVSSSTSNGANASTTLGSASSSSASSLAVIDPCTLITKAEATSILGGSPVVNTTATDCVYDLNGSVFKRLAVQVGATSVDAQAFAAQDQSIPGVCQLAGGGSKPAPVSNVGDAALEATDQQHVVARKGSRCYQVYLTPTNESALLSTAQTVASRL
jgi:hypothetical protein